MLLEDYGKIMIFLKDSADRKTNFVPLHNNYFGDVAIWFVN
jgi:hypothetical protein